MHDPATTPAPEMDWAQLRPQLDAAMDELDGPDRDAVLLRYLQDRPLRRDRKRPPDHRRGRAQTRRPRARQIAPPARRAHHLDSAALTLALTNQAGLAAPPAFRRSGRAGRGRRHRRAGRGHRLDHIYEHHQNHHRRGRIDRPCPAPAGWRCSRIFRPNCLRQPPRQTKPPAKPSLQQPRRSRPANRNHERRPEDSRGPTSRRRRRHASRPFSAQPARRGRGALSRWTNRGTATPAETLRPVSGRSRPFRRGRVGQHTLLRDRKAGRGGVFRHLVRRHPREVSHPGKTSR